MRIWAPLVALLLAALPCRAAEFEVPSPGALFQEPGRRLAYEGGLPFVLPDLFPRLQPMPPPAPVPGMRLKSAGPVVARLDLTKDMDRYLATSLSFRTRSGKSWRVSVNRVENCADGSNRCGEQDRYFVLFTSEQGEMASANVYQIADYSIFKSGKKDIAFDRDGAVYTVKLRLSGLSPQAVRGSRLEITCSRQAVFSATVDQVIGALSQRAAPAAMAKTYMAFLGRDLYQTPARDAYAGQTASLKLIPAGAQDVSELYSLPLSGITAGGVVYSSFPGYAFRRAAGPSVEIYRLH
ncbi:MAG: hypothetical protein PHU21_11395 [Elusimicrobia bacterium]|nr:hypothetical protein [Elusimicrobiota bacterium]